jgi:division protein CdvB (Snf7/Vps24/ESCRT-III family)
MTLSVNGACVNIVKFPWSRKKEVQIPPQPIQPPMRDRVTEIITKLRVQSEKLNRTTQRLQARAKELFDLCVRAQTEKDTARASMYANEIAELRKMNRVILRSQHSLEKVIIRLETVKEFGDVMNVLGPAVNVVQQIQGDLSGVVPEVAGDLSKVDEMLDTLLVEAGTVTGETLDITVRDQEARKVLEEASEIAAQRMKTSFPELPDAYKHLESDTEAKG